MTTLPGVPLPEMQRGWPGMELPGYRKQLAGAVTYSVFVYDALPAITRDLDDGLRWLCAEPIVPASLAETVEPSDRAATLQHLSDLPGARAIKLPTAFLNFIASAEPRTRIRSATDCYLDLGEAVVPVSSGGVLIHFLSDSQFCFHWLLYVGDNGEKAVVATREPYGFVHPDYWEDGAPIPLTFVPDDKPDTYVCANSFSEFLYRLWIENETWHRLALEHQPLTAEQQLYVAPYLETARLDWEGPIAQSDSQAVKSTLLARVLRRLGF
jgi:hypothetical protein